jgi:hypothetical protein
MKKILLAASLLLSLTSRAQTFTLKSKDLGGQATGKQEANGSGCNGSNLSPQLYWENPPSGTKSFAVTIFDESAPTGSGWWHWLIFDIPVSSRELKTGAGNLAQNLAPAGAIQSVTDFGSPGYGGPCPPPGTGIHRYVVTLYALKTDKLGLDGTTNPATVGFMLGQNVIEKASMIFYYKK